MAKYAVYLCGIPGNCPSDERFQHISMMGPVCVPTDFSERTGRSRTHKQRQVGDRYWWDGGCSAVLLGLLALAGGPRKQPPNPKAIRLEMTR